MKKILSIIIPTYNAEKYLRKCLESFGKIREEERRKCEILVINDGSSDDSVNIAKEFAEEQPEIFKIVHKENGGHGSAINVGVRAATGKYFKVVDADDWVDFQDAEKMIRLLETETADAIITGYWTYNIVEKVRKQYDVNVADESRYYNLDELMDKWKQIEWGMTFHGIWYRRDFYKSLHYTLVEHVFYEDQEYATIPLCYAQKIRCTNTHMYVYRIGDVNQSVSSENQIKRLPDAQKVIERMMEKGRDAKKFAIGGERYWQKKLTMMINSYYEISLLKDPDRVLGRKNARDLEKRIVECSPRIAQLDKHKYQIFRMMNYLRVKDTTYQKILARIKK